MVIWMCGVTRRDKIRNEHIRGTARVHGASVQEHYRKTTQVVWPCDEHERVGHSEKNAKMWTYQERRRGRPNPRWKDVCEREPERGMVEAGMKDDKTTNRTAMPQHGGIIDL